MSLSSALLEIYKSPAKLSITESLPLLYISRAEASPKFAFTLFSCFVFWWNFVNVTLPSSVIYGVVPPSPESVLNIISLSLELFVISKLPV